MKKIGIQEFSMIKSKRKGNWIAPAVGIILILLELGACSYDMNPYTPVVIPDSVSFSVDILPFLESTCAKAGCHASGGISPDLSASNAYTSLQGYVESDTSQAAQSEVYQKITTGAMAKYATDQDRALLLLWIKQGAKNN